MDKQKELLLKDLCARLPYGVIVLCDTDHRHKFVEELTPMHIFNFYQFDTKPYLRPMSSMTEEERKEKLSFFQIVELNSGLTPLLSALKSFEYIDWLNAHHFDYRGLIPMGLALEAPEGMYK